MGIRVFELVVNGGTCSHGPREPLERHSPGTPTSPFLPNQITPTAKSNFLLHVCHPKMVMAVVILLIILPKDTSSVRWQSPARRCTPKRETFDHLRQRYSWWTKQEEKNSVFKVY